MCKEGSASHGNKTYGHNSAWYVQRAFMRQGLSGWEFE